MQERHEIPTHLGVEDTAVLGLTFRQLLTAAAGLALAYGAADALPLPLPVRAVAGAVVLAAGLTLALWQPAGRPLEVWAVVLLAYAAGPRRAVWRPGEADHAPDDTQPAAVVVRLPVRPAPPTTHPPTPRRPAPLPIPTPVQPAQTRMEVTDGDRPTPPRAGAGPAVGGGHRR